MCLGAVVIGAGRMGREHALAVTAAGDEVLLVVDPDLNRATTLASEFRARAVGLDGDLGEVLGDVGVPASRTPVIIASPSAMHLDQASVALRLGFPVLLEKPPWVPGQDVANLVAEADRGVLAVGMTTRFAPGVQALREAVRRGELGRVEWLSDVVAFTVDPVVPLPSWYLDPLRSGGGVLVTNGVHSLDRVAWILGSALALEDVRLSSEFLGTCEDTAFLRLDGGGPCVTVTEIWGPGPVPPSQILIVGTRGTAWADSAGNWTVASMSGSSAGAPLPGHLNLQAQWRSFRDVVTRGTWDDVLPRVRELLPSMALLEQALARRVGTEKLEYGAS